ncbi:MAG: phospholipase [Myxococcota bacterium]
MLKNILSLVMAFSLGSQAGEFRLLFEASEHTLVGDEVSLPDGLEKLSLPNGLKLSFGEIVSMGDFYGIVGSPISEGANQKEKEGRFLSAFNLFASSGHAVGEVKQIVHALHENLDKLLPQIEAGFPVAEVFDKGGKERVKNWNCLTGGGCGVLWWTMPGRFLQLAEKNYDHFGHDSVTTYQIGHRLAVNHAVQAGKTSDQAGLELALAMEAFACHFLSDRFASGHIRVPRIELANEVYPSTVGSLLAGFMHNEDGADGLHVHNERGDKWVAFGDGRHLEPANRMNKRIMEEALQTSVNEINMAYRAQEVVSSAKALRLIPHADDQGLAGRVDIAPLFYWNEKTAQMMRRVNLADTRDYRWTADWTGVTTLAELQLLKGRW